MLFTLLTIALFIFASIRGVLASFAINSPQLVQCQSSKISWAPSTPNYNLIVASANDICGDTLVELGDFDTTFTNWVCTLAAGTQVYLSVMDSNEQEAWSNLITVGPSSNTSCLTNSGPSPASSSSPSPRPSTSVSPLGAANAGLFGSSGSPVTGQASLPIVAFAGLAIVVALL